MAAVNRPDWLASSRYGSLLDDSDLAALSELRPQVIPKGSVLFRPGDEPKGFVMLISGRVSVYLIARAGRELLLYSVEPGETCIQTTMGLLADQAYNAEAVTETDCSILLIPRPLFSQLMDQSAGFRSLVFAAFGERLADVTRMLEQVAFSAVGTRLARYLLDRRDNEGNINITHQELATAIGASREAVSRRLETLKRDGLVVLERGVIHISDTKGLSSLTDESD